MVNLKNTIDIHATPEKVWSVLGNLTRSPEYIPGIVSATMDDLTRVCYDTNGNEIREVLRYYSARDLTYAVEHVKTPLPVSYSQVQFSIYPVEQRAAVTLEWGLTFPDAAVAEQMKPMLDGASKMTLEGLKTLVEKE